MKLFQSLLPCPRAILLLTLASMIGCQTSGQENHDESDWLNRRQIPEYVMAQLPTSPDTLLKTKYAQYFQFGEIDTLLFRQIASENEKAIEQLVAFIGDNPFPRIIQYTLYPTPEYKGLSLKNSAPCHVDFENQHVHLIVNGYFQGLYLGQSYQLPLRWLLGEPKMAVLEKGLAVYFSDSWQKYGHQHWAKQLLHAQQLPPLAELMDEKTWEFSSDLIFGSAAASFVDFLITHFGKDAFFEKYRNSVFDEKELSDLEPQWKAHCATYQAKMEKSDPVLPYLKGFNFAHEGYRMYNGYGSEKAKQSLQHLANLHANAIAVVPYSFTRYPKEPYPIPVVKRAGTENDESVIQSAEDAQSIGLNVILKPQIWVGRGMWTGDIEMSSDEGWQLFFKHYSHWISHYALLAEIHGWESLCIGTELVATTLKRENDWKTMAQNIRYLFGGPLTYAANWGDEFEKTSLWEALDYVGLNCYYPLSKKEDPSDRDLKKGFNEVIEKIEMVYKKYKKPIVFTEIGFPCIEAPWKEPHNDWGKFTPSPIQQKRCYEIVFQNIAAQPWCNGILWWKYPSDLEHTRRRETGFSPHNKLAEGVVAKWFRLL